LRLDVDIAKDLYLAGKAHIGVLLEVAAQPELLHKGEFVRIDRGGDGDAISTAQAIAMTIAELPYATIDGHIVL
jgi:hypothetical protein